MDMAYSAENKPINPHDRRDPAKRGHRLAKLELEPEEEATGGGSP